MRLQLGIRVMQVEIRVLQSFKKRLRTFAYRAPLYHIERESRLFPQRALSYLICGDTRSRQQLHSVIMQHAITIPMRPKYAQTSHFLIEQIIYSRFTREQDHLVRLAAANVAVQLIEIQAQKYSIESLCIEHKLYTSKGRSLATQVSVIFHTARSWERDAEGRY